LFHSPADLQILCRSRQGLITQAWSSDGGLTWGPMSPTDLPNPSAGIDAITLTDGRFLLVYNPTTRGRRRLAVAISGDGQTWRPGVTLEDAQNGEYSYPAMIQTDDGQVHITYTWRRQRIKTRGVRPIAASVAPASRRSTHRSGWSADQACPLGVRIISFESRRCA